MPVNTRTAARRALDLRTFDDISRELDRIEASHAAGKLGHTGNWTPGQILQHVAKFLSRAFDGFEGGPPALVRVLGALVFKPMLLRGGKMPAGFKLPKDAAVLLPDDGASFEAGLAAMRAQLARVGTGERMSHPSPMLGKLTHEEWELLHAKHASLHFGFLSGVE